MTTSVSDILETIDKEVKCPACGDSVPSCCVRCPNCRGFMTEEAARQYEAIRVRTLLYEEWGELGEVSY